MTGILIGVTTGYVPSPSVNGSEKYMGLMDTTRPILGYVIAIAVVLILATMGFMATASSALVSSATTMADVLIIVALLVGIAAASAAARNA